MMPSTTVSQSEQSKDYLTTSGSFLMNARGELRHRMWADVDSQTLSGFVFHPYIFLELFPAIIFLPYRALSKQCMRCRSSSSDAGFIR